jgi:hypothetical protein
MCGEISFEYKLCRVTICGTEIQLRRLCTKHATPCSVHSAVHRQHLEHHRHCIHLTYPILHCLWLSAVLLHRPRPFFSQLELAAAHTYHRMRGSDWEGGTQRPPKKGKARRWMDWLGKKVKHLLTVTVHVHGRFKVTVSVHTVYITDRSFSRLDSADCRKPQETQCTYLN